MRYLMNGKDNVWNQMDNLMEGFFGNSPIEASKNRTPAVDIREDEDKYLIDAELPGISEKEIDIKVNDNLLTLSAEKSEKKEEKQEGYLRRERSLWSFKRSFVLPRDVDGKSIKADFENGVLTLELPRKEEAKALTIEVKKHK